VYIVEKSIPHSSSIRLARAQKQIDAIRARVISYNHGRPSRDGPPSKPYRFVKKPNSERVCLDLVFEVVEPIPDDIFLLASEALHHLRSSLDNLVYDLAGSPGLSGHSRLAFPIVSNQPKVGSDDEKRYNRMVKGVGPDAKAVIDGLQPYALRNDGEEGAQRANQLLQLATLSNIDKHRILPIGAGHKTTVTGGSIGIGEDNFGISHTLFAIPMLKHNTVIWECFPEHMSLDISIFCDIVLDDGWPNDVAGRILADMLSRIRLTIEEFVFPKFAALA
jgi:hypothetical protein